MQTYHHKLQLNIVQQSSNYLTTSLPTKSTTTLPNITISMSRNFEFLKISIMDSTTTLDYQHLLFLRVSPAPMFSTSTLYPLYHVKMDENKTKTLCTMHHHYSIHCSHTYNATACHQSISINALTYLQLAATTICSISIIVPHTNYVSTPHYN